jgi:glycosyltransferase involved in cell wall biosynthesis
LNELHSAGVEVRSYREFPDFGGNLAASPVRPSLTALGLLPWSTAEAVIKLTDWLRNSQPEVVHIWQDGLVYAAGLAALLAGVPRIVLSGRSTPPPDRRERYLVEYDVIYRSLLRAPGVKLSVNSTYAARRYAAWLELDPADIAVIPNGVTPLPTAGDALSEGMYANFNSRTTNATLTLGAVMRLDEVKRPLLWVETAAAIAARMPGSRFIVVGDGVYRTKAEKLAENLGIAERCLFVGRSDRIGYWLSKMNALILLSAHEGLPNALIEAQLAGVPVITSPAGGAPETVATGKTGVVTGASATPADVADLVAGLVGQPGLLREMGGAAREWAAETFPLSRMLDRTLDVYDFAGRSIYSSGTMPSPLPRTSP